MTEAQFQNHFNKWVKNVWKRSGVFELKVSKTSSIPFSAVKEHQIDALSAVNSGSGLAYKISDESSGYKPWDSFFLIHIDALIVVMFRANERGQEEFFMISPQRWVHEQERSERKSLTEQRARKIGEWLSL